MGLEVGAERRGDGQLLRVVGEVDLETSPGLLASLQKAVSSSPEVIVDLAGVDYIDSSGVAVLIQGLKQAGRRKVQFALLDPSPRVLGVLELAQLHALFDIRTSGASS